MGIDPDNVRKPVKGSQLLPNAKQYYRVLEIQYTQFVAIESN